jgi:hypothetical protein
LVEQLDDDFAQAVALPEDCVIFLESVVVAIDRGRDIGRKLLAAKCLVAASNLEPFGHERASVFASFHF